MSIGPPGAIVSRVPCCASRRRRVARVVVLSRRGALPLCPSLICSSLRRRRWWGMFVEPHRRCWRVCVALLGRLCGRWWDKFVEPHCRCAWLSRRPSWSLQQRFELQSPSRWACNALRLLVLPCVCRGGAPFHSCSASSVDSSVVRRGPCVESSCDVDNACVRRCCVLG